ncbi:MAG: membrane protein insertase YidC [Betaproteobacteria bacterium]|nr:membrane protein insertase YidC [Betaproteobacteria bacterium]
MDTQRLILFMLFTFSVFFLVEAWQKEKQPAQPSAPSVATTPASGTAATPVPRPSQPLAPAPAAAPPASSGALQKGETVRVETDVFVAEIDTAGGDLRRLELLAHRDTLDKKKNLVLLQQQPDHTYVAQSGLIGNGLPNHRTRYTTTDREVKLAPGADRVSVRLAAPAAGGLRVTKVYTFLRDSYLIDVGYEVENNSAAAIQPDAYFQLVRDGKPPDGDSAMLPTYTGMAVYTDREKFQKVAFADVDKGKIGYPKKSNDGWIALLQHYFLSAWLPANNAPREFYTQRLDNGLYAAGVIVSLGSIEPGANGALTVPLYAGPQEQDKLDKLAPGLDLTIDYGWLTVIAAPLFWFLQWLYRWVGNWGVAIIILTIIIKALFYPLSAASYRSMARMRIMAPRLQKIKEQYGNDRQRLNQAMMELYKTEKINPLGGCLPIVVQIPVFIALYWVLLASVELRHAPFMLWIDDLSTPDPYFVLPVLMGATMIFQTYLNPEPPDPVQAKIMKIMPIAFSIFFFFFPAGLVLYWLINNILSIAQQWQITRVMEHAKPAHDK